MPTLLHYQSTYLLSKPAAAVFFLPKTVAQNHNPRPHSHLRFQTTQKNVQKRVKTGSKDVKTGEKLAKRCRKLAKTCANLNRTGVRRGKENPVDPQGVARWNPKNRTPARCSITPDPGAAAPAPPPRNPAAPAKPVPEHCPAVLPDPKTCCNWFRPRRSPGQWECWPANCWSQN